MSEQLDPWPVILARWVERDAEAAIVARLRCSGVVHTCRDDDEVVDPQFEEEPAQGEPDGPKAGSRAAAMLAALREGAATGAELAGLAGIEAKAVRPHLLPWIRRGLVGFDEGRPRRFFLVAA